MSETIPTPDAASELVRTIAEREQRLAEAFAKQILSLERRALLAEQRLAVAKAGLVSLRNSYANDLGTGDCVRLAADALAAIDQIKEGK